MNRTEFRQLAEDRAADAKALLDVGRWSGSYYLAGYAIECGLKACILARIERDGVIFEEKRFIEKCWTHNIDALTDAAGLQPQRVKTVSMNPTFGGYWLLVTAWSESDRYKWRTEAQARQMYEAVTDHANGVLPWIRTHW